MSKSGIRIVHDVPGAGPEIKKGDRIRFTCDIQLNKGDYLAKDLQMTYTIGDRDVVDGFRYGIEQMRGGSASSRQVDTCVTETNLQRTFPKMLYWFLNSRTSNSCPYQTNEHPIELQEKQPYTTNSMPDYWLRPKVSRGKQLLALIALSAIVLPGVFIAGRGIFAGAAAAYICFALWIWKAARKRQRKPKIEDTNPRKPLL